MEQQDGIRKRVRGGSLEQIQDSTTLSPAQVRGGGGRLRELGP